MRIPIIYFLLLITLFTACKRDKPIASQEESVSINGSKAPILNIEVLQRPTEADSGDYIEVNIGEPVEISYAGIEKEKVIWTQEGLPLGETAELSTSHTWTEPGIKEIKATIQNGEERIVYVMVKGELVENSITSPEPNPSPSPSPTPNPDRSKSDIDKDGVPDDIDNCPNQKGSKSNNGCPDKDPPLDSDSDSVPDTKDLCPDQYGFKKFNGCPDSDGDGIPDNEDACPNVKGTKLFKGCPQPIKDRDGDGVPDKDDKCPDVKGPNNGCPVAPPPLDSDGDGVLDKDDKCPNVKGTNKGCPDDVPDFDKTGRAGFSNINCKGQKEVTESASITIKPKKVIELSHVKVIANFTGVANIKIEGDGTKSMKRQLNENTPSEINFQHLSYIMKPGNTYTITISGTSESFSLSDLSDCNQSTGSNSEVEISYGGAGKVFYNLTYNY